MHKLGTREREPKLIMHAKNGCCKWKKLTKKQEAEKEAAKKRREKRHSHIGKTLAKTNRPAPLVVKNKTEENKL